MNRLVSLVAAASIVMISLVGCSSSTLPKRYFCVPRIIVEPSSTHPGETIVVESDTKCGVPRPSEGWSVLVAPVGRPELGVRRSVIDDFDGSFRLEIALPANFITGDAFAQIENWDYSDCADTGSCASAGTSFTVAR